MTPLNNYKFRAELDWAQVEFTTSKRTKAAKLWELLRDEHAFVKPLDEGAGKAASHFVATIQEPGTWHALRQSMDTLKGYQPFRSGPRMVAIEVSFDAYSKAGDRRELTDAAVMFCRQLQNRVSGDMPRLHKGTTRLAFTERVLEEGFTAGETLYIGDEGAALQQRIYVKTRDNNQPLATAAHRARVEITMSGNAIPQLSWDDWSEFNFQSLARWFKFRELSGKFSHPWMRSVYEHDAHYGSTGPVGRRKGPIEVKAHKQLNAKAYDALRRLSGKMQVTPRSRNYGRATSVSS
jgi:hypothetical protein